MTHSDTLAPPLSLTDAAADQIKRIIKNDPERVYLRVAVQGGGCSGFSYQFELTGQYQPDDMIIEHEGAKVLIDPTSLPFLSGSRLDYTNELIGSAFRIDNPNAVAACGCGVSFSI